MVFGALIFVHELGHYFSAKWAGIKVLEFAMGMGPKIAGFTRGGTRYALRLLPIGGFVAVEGENDGLNIKAEDEGSPKKSIALPDAPLYKRFIFFFAGSLMNLALGLVILCVLSSQANLLGTTQIAAFSDDAVSSSQLQVGDTITRINGRRVRTDNDLLYEFMRQRHPTMRMEVDRGGEKLLLDVPFRMDRFDEAGPDFIYVDFKIVGAEPTAWGVIGNSFNWTGSLIRQVWGSFIDLLTGRFGFNQLSGPVGVTEAIGQASTAGARPFLLLVSYITVNLGVFNLLPFPALDGGRIIFLAIEGIRRKPVNPKYEGIVNIAGFVMLIGLMIFVTFSDIMKLFV